MKYLSLIFPILFLNIACSENKVPNPEPNEIIDLSDSSEFPLIPLPQKIEINEGFFILNEEVNIVHDSSTEIETRYLQNLIKESSNFTPALSLDTSYRFIQLSINTDLDKTIESQELYSLSITPENIILIGASNSGLMRGIQTLRQLFILPFHQKEKRNNWYLPATFIYDYPAFKHRGMLLDVCRHFFKKDIILNYIDVLAYYKMNVFHFHLTEDQGWRIPIEKYPLLTEIGAWRIDTNGNRYGGHYTKQELIEIVEYAAERHITVIPEIELPGHSQAAIAAYPNLSCTGDTVEVVNDWGVFKEIYCAGNDTTFLFIEDVLTEVMEIFPSKYIHIGGDETPKFRWEHCQKCQNRMKNEGLKDEHALQSYFIQRIEQFLNKNDRELIGWDEILEGGLSPNATVQSWRGFEGGIEAASSNHNVIMSPTSHCYLDYGLQSIDLKKIYDFNPIPKELDKKHHKYIIGGEGNMWTEHVPDLEDLNKKVFPRIIGLSEVLWTYNEKRNFAEFYKRIQNQYPVLNAFGISAGLETIGVSLSQIFASDSIQIQLNKNLPDLTLSYAWNENEYLTYSSPIPLEDGTLNVQAFRNDTTYGDPIQQNFKIHKGLLSTVTYKTNYNKWYSANETKALVDGQIGSLDFRDGNWQGFWGTDIDITVTLKEKQDIEKITLNFYQYANSWIFTPKKVGIQYSQDGVNWIKPPPIMNTIIDLSNKKSIKQFEFDGGKLPDIKYIRVYAISIGEVPEGHEAAGSDAWLFIDEIQIN